jgi:hypothetical protein
MTVQEIAAKKYECERVINELILKLAHETHCVVSVKVEERPPTSAGMRSLYSHEVARLIVTL